MAFKTYDDPVRESIPSTVSDLIRYYYSQSNGPLFVAAIGTLKTGGIPTAVFPAEMAEVIAVVALNSDRTRNFESNYGPSAELAGFIPGATVNTPSLGGTDGVSRIMGASGASATIAGIAALVWAKYPWLKNYEVRHRLRNSASHPNSHIWGDGYGYVDAYHAVGGFSHLNLWAPDCTTEHMGDLLVDVSATGDGPFQYRWNNGSTSATTSYPPAPPGSSLLIEVAVTDQYEGRTIIASKVVETVTSDDDRYIECMMG